MLFVCRTPIARPLVFAVEEFDKRLWQQFFEISHKDDIVLTMIVYPAAVALFGVSALCFACCSSVENLVERILVDISKYNV